VIDLANEFIKIWGSGQINTPPSEKSAPHEAHLLKLCIDKAIHELLWQPVLESSTAIEWTVSWYKAWHQENKALRSLSLNQIGNFQ